MRWRRAAKFVVQAYAIAMIGADVISNTCSYLQLMLSGASAIVIPTNIYGEQGIETAMIIAAVPCIALTTYWQYRRIWPRMVPASMRVDGVRT